MQEEHSGSFSSGACKRISWIQIAAFVLWNGSIWNISHSRGPCGSHDLTERWSSIIDDFIFSVEHNQREGWSYARRKPHWSLGNRRWIEIQIWINVVFFLHNCGAVGDMRHCHDMKTSWYRTAPTSLAGGESVMSSFDSFVVVNPTRLLNKQSSRRSFDTS